MVGSLVASSHPNGFETLFQSTPDIKSNITPTVTPNYIISLLALLYYTSLYFVVTHFPGYNNHKDSFICLEIVLSILLAGNFGFTAYMTPT
jgi:capsule polysaccharide modification protein KpsS